MMKIGRWWVGHPPYEELGRFADGTLSPEAWERVGLHLGACDRCRRELGTLHDAEEALRRVPVPTPPVDLFERILAQREDGGVLPLLPPDRPIRRPRRHAATAALTIVLAAVASSLLLGPPDLGAGTSHLSITWGSDRNSVRLQYTAGGEFGELDRLVARATIWTAVAEGWTTREATLERRGGVHEGWMEVPEELVYGLVGVEPPGGEIVDLSGGDFWEIPERTEGVSPDGYLGRLRALQVLFQNGIWVGRLGPARLGAEAAATYPDDARIWRFKQAVESLALPPGPELATMAEENRRALARLDALVVPRDADQIAAIAELAFSLDEPEIQDRWLDSLEVLEPGHVTFARLGVRNALTSIAPLVGRGGVIEPESYRALGEALRGPLARGWSGSPEAREWVRSVAHQFIPFLTDEERVEWFDRTYGGDLEDRAITIVSAFTFPDMRRWAVPRAEELITTLRSPPDSLRLFAQTASEFRLAQRRLASAVEMGLGEALEQLGDSTGSRNRYLDALQDRWSPEAARAVIELFGPDEDLEARAILDRLARLLAVDPLAEDDIPDTTDPWARLELLDLIGGGDPGRAVGSDELRLERLDGSLYRLGPRARAVVLLWSVVGSLQIEQAADEFGPLRRRLASRDVPLVIVGDPGWESQLAEVAMASGAEVLIDRTGAARDYFPIGSHPAQLAVSDGRFWSTGSVQDAARIALLLPPRAVVAEE